MAQFAHQYVSELLRRESALSQTHPTVIPTDIITAEKPTYSINLMTLLLIGVVMKAITDVGAVTDAQWIERLDQAIDSSPELPWPQWILTQVHPPA